MTSQPGWHPDPAPTPPGQAPQLRYWDGTRWTEHVAPAQASVPTQPIQPAAYGGTYGQTASPYGGTPYGVKAPPVTPDGVPLAGWWQRVLAFILDAIVLGIIGAILTFPWLRDIWHTYRDWIDEAMRSAESGGTFDSRELQGDIARPLAIIGVINLAVGFAYQVGFLMWKQATPGKLIVGLRVRLREQPGPMPLGTVALRWGAQFGVVGLVGLIPYVGTIGSLYSLLDLLWPLWDDKKQALHDKVAKTNVVRMR